MTPEIAENIIRLTMENGGGTFHTDGAPARFDFGYAVGIHEGSFMALSFSDLDVFPEAVSMMLKKFPDVNIGTWVNEGKIYLDPVMVLANRKMAEKVGRHFKQVAIYDFANKREIRL